MNTAYHSREKGGPDFSALLRIPNDLTSLRNYYSQMSLIDDGVGRLLAALASTGLDDDTLVIFTADHGFSLGHHGFWGHSQATWPSNAFRIAYNIPLIVRHPGAIQNGQSSSRYVSSMDLFATILEYTGSAAADGSGDIPSRSFAGLFDAPDAEWDDAVLYRTGRKPVRSAPRNGCFVERFRRKRRLPARQ